MEVKVAEMASESTYRETAHTLKAWMAVDISHTMVEKTMKQVGETQATADEEMVKKLERS